VASKAIALADQFQNEPRLAAALLSHVVTATRGVEDPDDAADEDNGDEGSFDDRPVDDRPAVAGDLHRQALEALDRLVSAHGDLTGAHMFRASTPEEAVEQIIGVLRESADPDLSDLLEMVARARVPAGMLALPLAKTYTEVLVHRAAGQLVSIPLDDNESELDVAAAREFLGSRVVVDLTSLLVLGTLDDTDGILGSFGQLLTTREAQDDVLRAVVSVQSLAASPGSIGWNTKSGRPWIREHTEAQYRLVRERTAMIENLARRATVRTQRAPVFPREVNAGIAHSPWVAAIELAAHEKVALWCDDLAVRRLARSVNVPTFSTMAAVEVLTEEALTDFTPAESVDQLVAMRADVAARMLAEYVVDVPVTTEQVIAQALIDNWKPFGAAALTLSRPGWWQWHSDPVAELLLVYTAVREHEPDLLPQWQLAAMLGAARGLPDETAARVLCLIALLGWDEKFTNEPPFETVLTGCRNARVAAAQLDGRADPLLAMPAILTTLTSMGMERSPETIQKILSTLGSDTEDD
ncbi:MAG: hypothetical protein HGA44_06065, partial [Cellulomonadaceae bacterium]|nr:hypothetical protein [Cellulomonadaceae bacterium]